MTSPSALAGVRVVEYTEMASASFCARLLGDAGADVVKVEPPEGDRLPQARPLPDPSTGSGQAPDPDWSGMFLYLNANKRGVPLDLQDPPQKTAFDDLVGKADILVVGGQSAEIERQGLRREVLQHLNPGLIVCRHHALRTVGAEQRVRGRRPDGGGRPAGCPSPPPAFPTAWRTRRRNLRSRPIPRWPN